MPLSNVSTPSGRRTIYLDLTDLLEYLRDNATVSGIQRVVTNLILHGRACAALHSARFQLVAPKYDRRSIFVVDTACVLEMLAALDDAGRDRSTLDHAIAAVYASRRLEIPQAGDVFSVAGAFWKYDDYDLLLSLRRRGVAVVAFIHDLIPISHPQFVAEAASSLFRRTFVDLALACTGLLTNSYFVEGEVRRFLHDRLELDIPVRAVPLATELPPLEAGDGHIESEVAALLDKPYVLSVSTLEIRKNQAYVVRVWQKLVAQGVDVPELVFVGKRGWDSAPLLELLESTSHLGGKVRILNNVSDRELGELYRHASFTMYMSFVEGFGLPVAESLAHAVPCIASSRSSMPEVGSRFARYLDPDDVPAGVELVRHLIENPPELENWRADVAANFRVRTWPEFVHGYMDALVALSDAPPRPATLAPSRIYRMGRSEVARRNACGQSLRYPFDTRVSGWHAMQDWGCWSASRRAVIAFVTGLPADTSASVYILVKAPPGPSIAMTIEVAEAEHRLGMISSQPTWHRLSCMTDPNGLLSLTFVAGEDNNTVAKHPSMDRFVGLMGIGFCPQQDLEARLSMVEAIAVDEHWVESPAPTPRAVLHGASSGPDTVDPAWYVAYYPDVQMLDLSAEDHYRWIGRRLGRFPNSAAMAAPRG